MTVEAFHRIAFILDIGPVEERRQTPNVILYFLLFLLLKNVVLSAMDSLTSSRRCQLQINKMK